MPTPARRSTDASDSELQAALEAATPVPEYRDVPRCRYCRGTVQHFTECPFLPGPQSRGCGACGTLLGITLAHGKLCGRCEREGYVAERDPLAAIERTS